MLGSIGAYKKISRADNVEDFVIGWKSRKKTEQGWKNCYEINKTKVDKRIMKFINSRKPRIEEEQAKEIDTSYYATKEHYPEYLLTEHWKNKRLSKLKQAQHICERCGSDRSLQVHHKTYKLDSGKSNLFHERLKDLEVLCQNCHQREHEIAEEEVLVPFLYEDKNHNICLKEGETLTKIGIARTMKYLSELILYDDYDK